MKKVIANYPGIQELFLMSGDGGVYTSPTAVQTVLGSCVAVTFFCPRWHIGATFHALMPHRDKDIDGVYRSVDSAIQQICASLFNQGVKQHEIECKVFGGANAMFQHELSVGPKNVQAAFEALASYPLRVVASHVGGQLGRKIVFISNTGEVFVRHIQRNHFGAP